MANDDLLGRLTPHSSEAERAVLGSILIDPECAARVVGLLKSSDFYSEQNRDIYDTISKMANYSMKIDALTVSSQMQSDGVHRDNTLDYLFDLMNLTPTSANVMEYTSIVRDRALLRLLSETGSDITEMATSGEGGALGVLDAAEQKVYALRQGRAASGLEPLSQILYTVYEDVKKAKDEGAELPGLPTGLGDLDDAILGLNKSDLIIIAARPAVGKTSIVLNMALHAARNSGKAVAIFNLEMSREQLALRLLSAESGVDNKKLQRGMINEYDWSRVREACGELAKVNMLINDNPTLTVSEMNSQCRRVDNLGLVVIDYLQLMSGSGSSTRYSNENRTQVVADMSRMMKIMAKELNVPVICLSQLNRASETRGDKSIKLADLRESGAIEQDADIVLGLNRLSSEETDENLTQLIILKNRRGETGVINLRFSPETTSFTTVDRRHNEGDYGQ